MNEPKKKLTLLIISTLTFLFLSSCSGNKAPQDALENYMKLRLGGSTDKDKYFDVVEGELKKFIEDMNEQDFKNFIDSAKNIKRRSLNVLHSTCDKAKCHFTYVVSLGFMKEKKVQFHADVKKVALIEKFEDSWKLTDIVSEPKTFIKGLDPITPEDFKKDFGADVDTIKLDRKGQPLLDADGKFQTN